MKTASGHRATGGMLALLLLACTVYWPGLSGGFLFDDFVNLDAIGATGPVDNWSTFLRYITSGTADPTGRPLALLSFLVDARDWPADPASFLRTNLLLHLLNGALLFRLLRQLEHRLDSSDRRAAWTALLATGLWLLHPLLVSTTLYVVQREAMLPGTFILTGLICYLHGHAQYTQENRSRGIIWMTAGIVGGTALALLCKGNGILLPMLAWVLDATILRHRAGSDLPDRTLQRARGALLTLPTLAVLFYLATFLPALNTPLESRGWTIGQRLLTEPRVIVDYLQLLVVPRSVSTGLYNDAYVVSTGLLQPWSTLACLLIVLSMLILAWKYRSTFPSLSAAVLFYFAGHSLESSVVPLELYFEHRNYLPAMLLFWPLARAVLSWQVSIRWRASVAAALISLVSVTTIQRASLWGQPKQLAALWARQAPNSSRAQATIAMLDTSAGDPEKALRRLGPLWKSRPNDLQIALNYINAKCAFRGVSPADARALAETLEHASHGIQIINGWLGNSIAMAATGQCEGLTLAESKAWLAAVLRNPAMAAASTRGQDVEPLLALIAVHERQPDVALRHFNLALVAFTTPDVAARQASILASSGYYAHALAHLDAYELLKESARPPGSGMPLLHAKVLEWQGYWPSEMAILRKKLHAEIDSRRTAPEEFD